VDLCCINNIRWSIVLLWTRIQQFFLEKNPRWRRFLSNLCQLLFALNYSKLRFSQKSLLRFVEAQNTPNPRFTRHFFTRFSDNTVEKMQPNHRLLKYLRHLGFVFKAQKSIRIYHLMLVIQHKTTKRFFTTYRHGLQGEESSGEELSEEKNLPTKNSPKRRIFRR
jgi:hypothetical protein